MSGTPQKFVGDDTKCFLCSNEIVNKDKIYFFGKSSVDLRGLISFAIDINLSADNDSENVFVCKQCYRSIVKLSNARRKLEDIKNIIK